MQILTSLGLLKFLRVVAVSIATALTLVACMAGPGFLKQDNAAVLSDSTSTVIVPVESSADGSMSATLSAQSGDTQAVVAPDGSAVAGSSLRFPPGTLGVDTVVTMEEGVSLANMDITTELGIGGVQASGASAALVISNSAKIDATQPFTVSLVLDNGSGLHLQQPNMQLVVFYKIIKAEEGSATFVGIIPNNELIVSGKNISFMTRFFGSFQAVYVPTEVAVPQEKPATKPIVTKRESETNGGETPEPSTPIADYPAVSEIKGLVLSRATDNSMTLKWQTPVAVKEFLVAFQLDPQLSTIYGAGSTGLGLIEPAVTVTADKCVGGTVRRIPFQSLQVEYNLTGLTPFSKYTVKVCAVGLAGDVSKGLNLSGMTKDQAPYDIQSLQAVSLTSRKVRLNMSLPAVYPEQLRVAWVLGTTAPSSCATTANVRDVPVSSEIILDEFPANTVVTFRVCSVNRDKVLSSGKVAQATTQNSPNICDTGTLDTTCVISNPRTISSVSEIFGLGNLQVTSTGKLIAGNSSLKIDVKGSVTVEAGGSISADAVASSGNPGDGSSIGNGICSGGSFGGEGGGAGPDKTYGTHSLDLTALRQPGSIGGCSTGGAGGGVLDIRSAAVFVSGKISANGGSGTYGSGGGSGGTVLIATDTISVQGVVGSIEAKGGAGSKNSNNGGGGGGGRIVFFARDVNHDISMLVGGGLADLSSPNLNGAPGTVFWHDTFHARTFLTVGSEDDDDFSSELMARTPISLLPDLALQELRITGKARAYFQVGGSNVTITDLWIDAGSSIDHSGMGNPGAPSPMVTSGAFDGQSVASGGLFGGGGGGGGGGAGGAGAGSGTAGGIENENDEDKPVLPGGGGGSGTDGLSEFAAGGDGGGALMITLTGGLLLEGNIIADGRDGQKHMDYCGGGGGGGSIWIKAASIDGSGNIFARGGDGGDACTSQGFGGGGGGGRVFIEVTTKESDGFSCDVSGGVGANPGVDGTAKLRVGNSAVVDCQMPI